MNTKRLALLSLVALLLLALPGSALAQTYSFSLDREVVNVFWNADGTQSIDYLFTFTNDTGVSPIDYVDVGVPNANYDLGSVTADVDGRVLTDALIPQYVDSSLIRYVDLEGSGQKLPLESGLDTEAEAIIVGRLRDLGYVG